MKNFIARLFNGPSESAEGPPPETPAVGQIYAFRTRPLSEFAASPTGRYAAFKMLASDQAIHVAAALDGIWTTPPTLKQASQAGILREHRFAHTGRANVIRVSADEWPPTEAYDDLRYLGKSPLTAEERELGEVAARGGVGTAYASIHFANYSTEGEWRWANDRDALIAEREKEKAKEQAERAARQDRYENRLRKLTWDQLLSETPFAHWSPSPPYPPEAFTSQARAEIHRACRTLQALGPKPGRKDVRAIMTATVVWFNEADERAGGVIETEERENIFAVLEEMAHVARQPSVMADVDAVRDW